MLSTVHRIDSTHTSFPTFVIQNYNKWVQILQLLIQTTTFNDQPAHLHTHTNFIFIYHIFRVARTVVGIRTVYVYEH